MGTGRAVFLSILPWALAASVVGPAGAALAAPAGQSQAPPPPPPQWPSEEFSAQPDSGSLMSSARCDADGPISSITLNRRSFQKLSDRERMAKRVYAAAAQYNGLTVGQAGLEDLNRALDPFDSVLSANIRCWGASIDLEIRGFGEIDGKSPYPLTLTTTIDAKGFRRITVMRSHGS